MGALFVCYGNACRSIMGEALARHHLNGTLEVASAGIAPLGHIPQLTRQVLEEASVSCQGLYSKGLEEIDLARMDLIINLAGLPIGQFIPSAYHSRIIVSYVPDPYGRGLGSFRQARDEIEQIVLDKLPKWISDRLA